MKKILKIAAILVLVAYTTEFYAQKIGIKAGVNLANMVIKDDDDTYSDDLKMNLGFNAGATLEIPFGDMFSLETGLIASTRGAKESGEILGEDYTMKANIIALDIPITPKVSFGAGSTKVYVIVGPYVGFALTGKYVTEIAGEKESEDIDFGSDEAEDDMKRLDYGLIAGAGVEIGPIAIGGQYQLGLANVSPYTEGGFKISHNVIGFSVGYKFGGE